MNKIKKMTLVVCIFALPAVAFASVSTINFIDLVIESESLTLSCEYENDVFVRGNNVKEPREFLVTLNRRPLKEDGLSSLLLNGGISIRTKSFGNFVMNDFKADREGDLVNIFNKVGQIGNILTLSGDPLSIKITNFKAARPGSSGPSNSSGLGRPSKPEVNRIDYLSSNCTIL